MLKESKRWIIDDRPSSPRKEELELLRVGNDSRLDGSFMRQAFKAGKMGGWADFLKNESSTHGQS